MKTRFATMLMAVLLLLGGCPGTSGTEDGGAADGPAVVDGGGGDDGGGGGDGGTTVCVGQGECACRGLSACQPIAEMCWCPYPTCGQGACICAGGKFLGCAQKTSGCDAVVNCRPAGRPGPQDPRGCVACSYESDCQRAFDRMVTTCAAKKNLLTAFSCANKPDCVTQCINNLASCEDIGCGLCAQCGCGKVGLFEQCVSACMK